MRIELSGLTVTIPDGWEDRSNYSYTGNDESEQLLVTYREFDGSRTAATLLEEVRQDLQDGFGDDIELSASERATLGSSEIDYFSFTFDSARDRREFVATSIIGDGTSVLISYRAPANNTPAAEQTFRDILASVRLTGTRSPSPGERAAGRISLAVPQRLASPEFYRFSNAEDTIEVVLHPGPATEDYIFGPFAQEPQNAIAVESLDDLGRAGTLYRYELDESQSPSGTRERVYRAVLGKGTETLDIRLSGNPAEAAALEQAWRSWIDRIELHE